MKNQLSKIYLISHEAKGRELLDSLEQSFIGGIRLLQLRLKDYTEGEALLTSEKVKKLTDKYNVKLIINDYPEIAKGIKADGVHLGKNDMKPDLAREIIGENMIIGGTADSFERVLQIKDYVDYIGLGPYRFTSTKRNLSPVLGVKGIKEVMEKCSHALISKPFYVIGGIKHSDLGSISKTGVWGVSVSSSILKAEDITKTAAEFVEFYDE